MSINPLKAAQTIASNYQSYLSTTFRLQDQALQEQFLAKLSDTDRFIKGPLLEVTPAFKTGASIADLIKEGILAAEFASLSSELLPQNRPLYWHQEQAIRKLVSQGRNIVVCTGTGSGKTETFIIPILNHLLREKEQGTLGPGVRALLLYPMNALANDQLMRLRQLLKNCPDITFGRYTGETETKQAEAREKYCKIYQREPLPNELIAREQMWQSPPHILLTNYAMLEYLLLRPQDNVFFDGALARYWRFLVIDEAHIYSGARGIEIAMLLRRLKDRVVSGEQGKLQCIATSATLGSDRDNKQQIVDFARQLFGENFAWEEEDERKCDVVEAVRLPLVESYRSWGKPAPWIYGAWEALINQNLSLDELIPKMTRAGREAGIPGPELDRAAAAGRKDGWQTFLHEILAGDAYLLRLQQELQEKPRLLQELPGLLGLATPAALETVVSLVNLANQARPHKDSQALLPARFHFFVRALEGAYISLWPEKKLYLARRENVTVHGQEYRAFEIAVCRQCGALYLVGFQGKK